MGLTRGGGPSRYMVILAKHTAMISVRSTNFELSSCQCFKIVQILHQIDQFLPQIEQEKTVFSLNFQDFAELMFQHAETIYRHRAWL